MPDPKDLIAVALSLLALMPGAGMAQEPAGKAEFPGRIEALVQYDVSNQVDGILTGIHFKPGQKIARGDLLFTLDDTDLRLELQSKQADVKHAEAALAAARRDLERLTTLAGKGSATTVQLLKADVAQSFANAILAQKHAAVEEAKVDLSRTVLHAPIDGIIGAPAVSPGAYVEVGGKPLATIVQLDPVRLSYRVPYVERIEAMGLEDLRFPDSILSRVTLTVKLSEDWTYPITTHPTHAAAEVDPETGTITIWAELANPKGQLRPGMAVTVVPDTDGD